MATTQVPFALPRADRPTRCGAPPTGFYTKSDPAQRNTNRARCPKPNTELPSFAGVMYVKPAEFGANSVPVAAPTRDVHVAVAHCSDLVPYAAPATPTRRRHHPYMGTESRVVSVAVENFPFERSGTIEADLAGLLAHLSRYIAVLSSDPAERAEGYIRFAGMDLGRDSPTIALDKPAPNGSRTAPAKRRHILVHTNCTRATFFRVLRGDAESRSDPDTLLVLPDRSGFRVCVATAPAVCPTAAAAVGINAPPLHSPADAEAFVDYTNEVRRMGLRARHRHCDGMPATTLRFAVPKQVTTSTSLLPAPRN